MSFSLLLPRTQILFSSFSGPLFIILLDLEMDLAAADGDISVS